MFGGLGIKSAAALGAPSAPSAHTACGPLSAVVLCAVSPPHLNRISRFQYASAAFSGSAACVRARAITHNSMVVCVSINNALCNEIARISCIFANNAHSAKSACERRACKGITTTMPCAHHDDDGGGLTSSQIICRYVNPMGWHA